MMILISPRKTKIERKSNQICCGDEGGNNRDPRRDEGRGDRVSCSQSGQFLPYGQSESSAHDDRFLDAFQIDTIGVIEPRLDAVDEFQVDDR